jgi:hypothetical protein
MDKKEKTLLPINMMDATPVNSSIMVWELNFDILIEVRTTRQNPSKLEDVFRIC